MALACSFLQREEFEPTAVQEAPTEEQIISPLCPRLLSDSCLHAVCVQAICSSGYTVLLCFISGTQLVSKF